MTRREFGNRLKQLRIAKGWTVRQLAEYSGVPKKTIEYHEQAARFKGKEPEDKANIMPATLKKLAEALGVSPDRLFG